MDKRLPDGQIFEKPPAHHSPPAMVVAAQGGDASHGLTLLKAQSRLQIYGPNTLPSIPPLPAWRRFLPQFRGPLTLLLLVATVISLAVWWTLRESVFPYETLTIFAILLLNAMLRYTQEQRAEQAVAALQAMSAATTRMLRDGSARTIATAEVVPGDILLIEKGDTIAADARVLIAGCGTLPYAQTMAFATLVLAQLYNVFNARSYEASAFRSLLTNRWVWLTILVSLLLQAAIVYLPPLQTAFRTVPLSIANWLLCLAVASATLWGRELTKALLCFASKRRSQRTRTQSERPFERRV